VKCIRDNDTIQLEITSFCPKNCSNCTRACGHYGGKVKHWFMDFETFQKSVDSMVGFKASQGVGIMGGEPLFHPEFEKFARYAAEKLGPETLGLWSCFPPEKKHLGPVIAECFTTVFPNDHTRQDVIHAPFLVSSKEVIKDPKDLFYLIDHCWAQKAWSASVNPNGAFFCEIAAALSVLFDIKKTAWPIEPQWWAKTPIDYVDQIKEFCPLCGGAIPLGWRYSLETVDDVSPGMLERLKAIESPKISREEYAVHNLQLCVEKRPQATYKDESYRQEIVRPYGLFLVLNDRGFMTPYSRIVGNKKISLADAGKGACGTGG
jgi:hypothetical protein